MIDKNNSENDLNEIILPDMNRALSVYKKNVSIYEKVLKIIDKDLKKMLNNNKISFSIKRRVKSFDNYYTKLSHQRDENITKKLTDIFGIRIVCPFLEDVKKVEKIIESNMKLLEKEKKGSTYSFKEFGYESIHFLIKLPKETEKNEKIRFVKLPHSERVCEIQLRTILQDAWAEVEHELIYKFNLSKYNESVKRKMASLNASLTLSDIIFQEIRDYNRELQIKEEKRRYSVFEEIDVSGDIALYNETVESTSTTTSKKIGNKKDNEKHDFILPKDHSIKKKKKDDRKIDQLIIDGLTAHSDNEISKAIDIYTLILKKKPSEEIRSIIYNHRGMAFFVESKYQKAIKDFSRAIDYNSKNFRAFNNRGKTFRLLHEHELALKDFNHSIDRKENQLDCLYSRALVYFDIQDYASALDDCEKVLKINPDFKPGISLKRMIMKRIF